MEKICSLDRVLLEEYVDGMLNEIERLLVEEHIKSCDSCRKQLTEMKLLFWEIESISDRPIAFPDELGLLADKLMATVKTKPDTVFKKVSNVFATQKRVTLAALGFSKSLPLARETKTVVKKTLQTSSTLFARLTENLKISGKKLLKRRLTSLLGGTK